MPGQNIPRADTNVDGISLFALVAANASQIGADRNNQFSSGITIVIDITAVSGTGASLTIVLEGKDPISGKYYTILQSAALTAVATTVLRVFPGSVVNANLNGNSIIPKTFRARAVIAGTTPLITATVAAAMNA
jgi:hypothetical protein